MAVAASRADSQVASGPNVAVHFAEYVRGVAKVVFVRCRNAQLGVCPGCNGVYVLLRPGIRNKELAGSDAAHIGTAIDFMCVSNGNRE